MMQVALVSVVLLLIAGCASQRASEPAPAAAPSSEAPAATPETTVQKAWKAGYKMVNQNGEAVYCREQLKTGSHLRKETICLTERELEMAREASERNLEQMQRRVPPPHGT